MKKKEDILQQVGRSTGYKVPEGYFENFTARMTEQLPERELPKPEIVTPWQKFRPYIYMAAMLAQVASLCSSYCWGRQGNDCC